MPKTVIALNSHSLSNFQRCPANYFFNDVLNLRPLQAKAYFERGTLFSKWLQLYYYNKIKPRKSREMALLNIVAWTKRFRESMGITQQEALSLFKLLVGYKETYKNETWTPLGVEKGFSIVIYEDEDNLFIFEGRPDLIVKEGDDLVVVDHKSRGRSYELYPYNNQVFGYMFACNTNKFVYNYITCVKDLDKQYARTAFQVSEADIAAWKNQTIKWFFKVKEAMQNGYVESKQCTELSGICRFHRICEQPSEVVKSAIIRANFTLGEPRRSW